MDLYPKIKFTCLVICLIALGSVFTFKVQSESPGPVDLSPSPGFVASQNEKLLDTIFEEEKSNAVCRFLKSKKMKA